jgi:hypothetical protein
VAIETFGDGGICRLYGAPPKGLFLKRYLDRLADWLADDLVQRGLRPGLVHAHKLSVEGLVGAALAQRLGVPLAISVQGDSDLKIIGARRVPEIRLEIIGGGDAAAFTRLAALAERVAPGRVRFLGAVPNTDMQALLNASCAFALAPHRESFGMVFAEALLAGCPCLIPQRWGIDGYLDDGGVLLAVPSRDVTAIAGGLVRLAREEAGFKARLARLAETGGLDLFRRDAIAAVYRAGLAEAAPG